MKRNIISKKEIEEYCSMQKDCFQCSVYRAYNECAFVLREKELKKQKRNDVLYKLLHGYVNKHKVAKLLSDILRRKGHRR